MTIKRVLSLIFSFLGCIIAFGLAWFLLNEVFVAMENLSPFLDAVKITGEQDIAKLDDQIVWVRGSFVLAEGAAPVIARLSEKQCLYYHYEKQKEIWIPDDEGESSQSWRTEQDEKKAAAVELKAGEQRLQCKTGAFVLKRMPPVKDYEEVDDGITYRYIEHVIPLENTVTVIGKLIHNELKATDRGIIVSFSSFENLLPEFKGDIVMGLFFIILVYILAAGLFVIFLSHIFTDWKWRPSRVNIVFFFGALVYIWILTGGMLLSLSSDLLADKIISITMVGIIASSVFLFPLISHACHNEVSPAALLFIPAVALVIFSAFFYFNSFFTVGNWVLPLFAAIPLSLASAGIMVFCRWIAGR
ncbi:MAG: hypothetical protein JW904_06335 [Spirochaetales bacterium]|nr:hypothetical protein [Spirochaetales bacterium]